jgi:hypothetical protein
MVACRRKSLSSEIGALAAAFANGDSFTVEDPYGAEGIVSLGEKPLCFRGHVAFYYRDQVGFTSLLSHERIQEDAKVGCRLFGAPPINEFAEALMSVLHRRGPLFFDSGQRLDRLSQRRFSANIFKD